MIVSNHDMVFFVVEIGFEILVKNLIKYAFDYFMVIFE